MEVLVAEPTPGDRSIGDRRDSALPGREIFQLRRGTWIMRSGNRGQHRPVPFAQPVASGPRKRDTTRVGSAPDPARRGRQAYCGEGEGGIHPRSEEHTSELQSQSNLVCRLLLEKKKKKNKTANYCETRKQLRKTPNT